MALSVTSLCCLSDRLTLTWHLRKSSSVSSPLGADSFCSVMCFCLLYLQFAARVSCTIVSKPHVTELDLGWVFHRYRLLVTFQLSGAWRSGAVFNTEVDSRQSHVRVIQTWDGWTVTVLYCRSQCGCCPLSALSICLPCSDHQWRREAVGGSDATWWLFKNHRLKK